jgi:hypothetical protein
VAPQQHAVRSATGGAAEHLYEAYDGFGGAEMNAMFMLRTCVRPAEQVGYCSRERRNAWVPDNFVNILVTKTVSREQRLDHR